MRWLTAALLALLATGTLRADDLSQGLAPPEQRSAQRAAKNAFPLIGLDVRSVNEDALLGGSKKPALFGVAAVGTDFHPEREPLILVHGINGDFQDFQPLVDRFARDARLQIYVLAYSDMHERTSKNGDGFAQALRGLADALGNGRDVTIVAHSMGGLVTRRALDELTAGPAKGIERFHRVRFVAVDTPWHGAWGPGDHGANGFVMKLVEKLMPKGIVDMRARSDMFEGDEKSADAAAKDGMFGVALPANVEVRLVFAQQGKQASDWTEKPLKDLPAKLVALYARGEPVSGDQRLENFFCALRESATFGQLDAKLRALAAAGKLDEKAVSAALEESYPRFPGDHVSVLAGPFLDYLEALLAR